MSLSKSKYIKGSQCKKFLWLEENKPEEKEEVANNSVLETGNFIHEVAKYLFNNHINIEFSENLNDMIENTNYTMESYKNVVITEASFNYNNNFCSVDILKKNGNKYEIYEVKGSTKTNNVYVKDISYQYYVLTSLGLNVCRCYLVYLDKNYVREDKLDLNKLFIKQDITEEIINLQSEVKQNINEINKYLLNTIEPKEKVDEKCFKPYDCPFFSYCTRHIPKYSVFNLSGMSISKKIALYTQGLISYEDLLKVDINENFKQQIDFELNNKSPYINKEKIRKFLKELTYPLYFLDFETCQQPIPLFKGVSPYMQIPFQYSLHILTEENGPLIHTEFLGDGVNDPRRKLAEQLVNDIPKDACTVAYNMTFEKTIIKSLAKMYPDLKDHLMNIYNNMKDLMIPFKNRYYYTKDMKGSYSIKYVLPALYPNDPSLNYSNLDQVHNGSEAMNSYNKLKSLNNEEQEKLRYNMLKYCSLDTLAMVKIWEYLKKV